ncbi:MAG: GIY-YIG nuclease family protein [Tissierella sp.]|uniref:GIY-YIG nuclease family protein n=1 Tax=Tissierella sp. TaxID=41274 RepID=UPI003F949A53
MQRVVTYLYPEHENASSLKVFQDRTNQIKAFYFTRDYIKKVESLESGKNYAVYFLFDKTEDGEMTKVYVGKSTNGANRMQSHNNNKMFWSFCLMFVTDNDTFDTLTIDYMEYYFIRKLETSGRYFLENKVMRNTEPNVSIFDKPTVNSYINQIEFLLKAEGINFEEEKSNYLTKFYYPRSKKYKAKIFVKDGEFILSEGSIVSPPIESSKNWSDEGKFYNKYINYINDFLEDDKIEDCEGKYKTLINLTFTSPSAVASLISGRAENGWKFFDKIEELRE